MKKEFNYVDIAFVIDTTGSMGPFIAEAKKHLSRTLEELSKKSGISLNAALVEYKDHPPQDRTFVTRCVDFTSNFPKMQDEITKLKESGGGDGPEAVYRGVYDACEELSWRDHSSRFVLLVGDAPPHAFAAWYNKKFPRAKPPLRPTGDGFPNACASGLDVSSVTAAAEKKGIVVNAICLVKDDYTAKSFDAIATGTGGRSYEQSSIGDVIAKIKQMLDDEFQQLKFDENIFQTIEKTKVYDCQELAEKVSSTRQKVAFAISRLGRRGFLN